MTIKQREVEFKDGMTVQEWLKENKRTEADVKKGRVDVMWHAFQSNAVRSDRKWLNYKVENVIFRWAEKNGKIAKEYPSYYVLYVEV